MFSRFGRDVGFPIAGCAVLFAVFVTGGLLYQSLQARAAERLVTVMLIDAIIVLGIQIYVGNTGVLSFGHIGFGAIAGYAFAVFRHQPRRETQAHSRCSIRIAGSAAEPSCWPVPWPSG
ncbi:hypothetical protein [Candidatus Poriferisodalis sp.]|uniref:hypothetical protein n=1 Tax=Candidatus Poriferisodalis sp. TaxID=3101277 RepID=UPI003B5AC296